uniref:Uncharacterized protein n=1 Tax=Cannabis sativa TaxID=3483 RepID=A0A803Q708_CANSA
MDKPRLLSKSSTSLPACDPTLPYRMADVASIVTQADIWRTINEYTVERGFNPLPEDRANLPPMDMVAFSKSILKVGVAWPLHPSSLRSSYYLHKKVPSDASVASVLSNAVKHWKENFFFVLKQGVLEVFRMPRDVAAEEVVMDSAREVLEGWQWSCATGKSLGGCPSSEKMVMPAVHQSEPACPKILPKGLLAKTKTFLKKNIGGKPSTSSSLGRHFDVEERVSSGPWSSMPFGPPPDIGLPLSTLSDIGGERLMEEEPRVIFPHHQGSPLIHEQQGHDASFCAMELFLGADMCLSLYGGGLTVPVLIFKGGLGWHTGGSPTRLVRATLPLLCWRKEAQEQTVADLAAYGDYKELREELKAASQRSAEHDGAMVDQALYNVWRINPNTDFSSFGPEAVQQVAEWRAYFDQSRGSY